MAKVEDTQGFQALKEAIRSGAPENLYIFHGEETYLMRHYLGLLRSKLLDALTESFNFHRFTQETFQLQDFAESLEAMPMMAEHTLIQVDEIDLFKLSEGERSKMVEMLGDIPYYCTVVFTYETTPWKPDKRQKKLWDVISKHGCVVEFARQSPRELASWVTRWFAKLGKHISRDLCLYLIDITGGTMTALSGEIQKIAAFSGTDEITKYDIDAVTEPVMDAVVFQMTDLLSQGNYGAALQKLQQLFKMQQEPIAILGAVGSHFRRLGIARTLLDHGRNSGELMRLCGIGEYPARKTMGTARQFTPFFCKKASVLILETDYKMKTSYDDPERLLELLLLALSREARSGKN